MTTTKVPKFLHCLYDMLHFEDQSILAWTHDGTCFQVRDVARLERDVLPKYFKHGKFTSFQRQLNTHGFHKWTKTRAHVCTFSHDALVQCHPNSLSTMIAMTYTGSSKASTTMAIESQVTGLKHQRDESQLTFSLETTEPTKKHKQLCVETVDITLFDDLLTGSPLVLLDAVDVSDLLALDWAAASGIDMDEDMLLQLDPLNMTLDAECGDFEVYDLDALVDLTDYSSSEEHFLAEVLADVDVSLLELEGALDFFSE